MIAFTDAQGRDMASEAANMLDHGRDTLSTWDSVAYWEGGTKGPGLWFY